MRRKMPNLSTLLNTFNSSFEDLPATRFDTTRRYHEFANDLIDAGVSFRVRILKRTRTRPSQIIVMLLQEVDMTRPDNLPLEPHQHEIDDVDSVDIIGSCPNCGVLLSNSESCSYCGGNIAQMYTQEYKDDAVQH
jgi:hypothetical protein